MFRLIRIISGIILLSIISNNAFAGTPISLYRSFAGNLNYVTTGASLRTQSNDVNPSSVTTSKSAVLSGIPSGAVIKAAYLYWAGSYSTSFGSTLTTPDYNVDFDSQSISADRTFTEVYDYNGTMLDYFSGVEDVTSIVVSKGNGTYNLSNLSINNGNPHSGVQGVVSGWGLIVIYERSEEAFRVINLYDGFQYMRGSSIVFNPGNFSIPANSINGKLSHITWEGDEGNSDDLDGYSENLTFNGSSLTDSYNPLHNQFNSTINTQSTSASYGVDIDTYDVSSFLRAGDTSATSVYQTGGDLVLLSAEIISVTNTPVADLSITNTHAGNFTVGQNATYTMTVSNNGPNVCNEPITVTDNLPAGLSYVSSSGNDWVVNTSALPTLTWTYTGYLDVGESLPAITLTVQVLPDAYPSVSNTATVSSVIFDNVAGNSSSTHTGTVVRSDLSTSAITVVDQNGGYAEPFDILRYTITVIETAGVAASGVSVTDDIPGEVTNFSVISFPSGATNSSTGTGTGAYLKGYLNITGINVPANGTVTIVFEVRIASSLSPGDIISNSVIVNNPYGEGAEPEAPNIIVSQNQVPASGLKPLYLTNLSSTRILSRVEPLSNTNVTINGSGGYVTITQSPPTKSTLTLSSGTINVVLLLSRGSTSGYRTVNVALTYSGGSSGTIGNKSQTISLSTTPQLYTFTINLASARTLNANTSISLKVTNNSTNSNRDIIIGTVSGSNRSKVSLNTSTVINIDNVVLYSGAYPGGTNFTSMRPGAPVYIRAEISDPFGSFDITGSKLTITDPINLQVVSNADMDSVYDSHSATKIYEYLFPMAPLASNGVWHFRVIASEGSEGTVTHTRTASLMVALPSIMALKSVQTISDPFNSTFNPKSIPGSEMLYTIQLSNQGVGWADSNSTFITDEISSNLKLYVEDLGVEESGPILFVNGSPPSGLTYTYTSLDSNTDDIDFSNNQGMTWNYIPEPDPDGYDENITNIRIKPKGTFLGTDSGNPTFEVKFKVKIK